MRYSSSAHMRFYHRFHVVWVTKYRYKVLQGAMREKIREIIIQTCNEMGGHIVKGVLARDHVHMFLSIPPKLSLSDLMQRIKGRSSRRIQMEFPELRKRYWGRRFVSIRRGTRSRGLDCFLLDLPVPWEQFRQA